VPESHLEKALGSVDGSNVSFLTALPYLDGSVVLFLNGQGKRADYDDGWVETSSVSGLVTLKEPPRVGDEVFFFFLDTLPDGFGEPPEGFFDLVCDQVFLDLLDPGITLTEVPGAIANFELLDSGALFALLPRPAEVVTEIFLSIIDPDITIRMEGAAELEVVTGNVNIYLFDDRADFKVGD
jgi:hypothetical protein